jgi:putative transposase
VEKSRFAEEQSTYALRHSEAGTPVADVCRQLRVSEASFYVWKKKYGKLGLTELRELRPLHDENARLKRVVAELTLDRHILGELVGKKALKPARPRALVGQGAVPGEYEQGLSPAPVLSHDLSPEEPGAGPVGAAVPDP